MKQIRLDTILIFALLIPVIMTYRISPGSTPFWLFGIIFLLLAINIVLDLGFLNLKDPAYFLAKKILIWILIFASIGAALFATIVVRHETSPIYNVHDIIVQQEAAVRFFLHGQNPYSATYFATPLSQWHYSDTEINPALYHFVMEPFYLLFPIPFYLIMGHAIGFFDARIPLFFLFLLTLILGQKIVKDEDKKRLFLVLFAFNPANTGYFLEGRDDIFMFVFLVGALFFIYKKKYTFSAISLALGFATKQSIWPLFPFFGLYLYSHFALQKTGVLSALRKAIMVIIPFAITFLLFIMPFFIWNPHAFLDSTIFYLSGNTLHSYPVAGYGLGILLNEFGLIHDVHAYYPFWIWQIIVGLPVLTFLLIYLQKNCSARNMLIVYGIFLFVFWYFARYFNNSHFAYLSMIFIFAYFLPENDPVHHKIE